MSIGQRVPRKEVELSMLLAKLGDCVDAPASERLRRALSRFNALDLHDLSGAIAEYSRRKCDLAIEVHEQLRQEAFDE